MPFNFANDITSAEHWENSLIKKNHKSDAPWYFDIKQIFIT